MSHMIVTCDRCVTFLKPLKIASLSFNAMKVNTSGRARRAVRDGPKTQRKSFFFLVFYVFFSSEEVEQGGRCCVEKMEGTVDITIEYQLHHDSKVSKTMIFSGLASKPLTRELILVNVPQSIVDALVLLVVEFACRTDVFSRELPEKKNLRLDSSLLKEAFSTWSQG